MYLQLCNSNTIHKGGDDKYDNAYKFDLIMSLLLIMLVT